MEIVEGLVRQAKGETDIDVARGDIALAYGRAARAVRFTIALQSKLIADFQSFGRETSLAPGGGEARIVKVSWDDRGQDRRTGAARILGRVIAAEADSPEAAERLTREANERLDDLTLCGDLNRPFSEIVADICQDLGLSPDWAALSEEAWAREELKDGRPGAPLKTLSPNQIGGEGRVRGWAARNGGRLHGVDPASLPANSGGTAPHPTLSPQEWGEGFYWRLWIHLRSPHP